MQIVSSASTVANKLPSLEKEHLLIYLLEERFSWNSALLLKSQSLVV